MLSILYYCSLESHQSHGFGLAPAVPSCHPLSVRKTLRSNPHLPCRQTRCPSCPGTQIGQEFDINQTMKYNPQVGESMWPASIITSTSINIHQLPVVKSTQMTSLLRKKENQIKKKPYTVSKLVGCWPKPCSYTVSNSKSKTIRQLSEISLGLMWINVVTLCLDSLSLSVIGDIGRITSGVFTPLFAFKRPATVTLQSTKGVQSCTGGV